MSDNQPKPDDADASATIPLYLRLQPGGPALQVTRSGSILGRHSSVDVRLPLPDVSRWHCRFVYADSSWYVEDLNSLNGVFVNGSRVPRAILSDGDIVAIGGLAFEIQFNRAATAGPLPVTLSVSPEDSAEHSLPMPTQSITLPHRKAS
jgi:predicted component of type VI protein secretion system